jgi:hypothetical protein
VTEVRAAKLQEFVLRVSRHGAKCRIYAEEAAFLPLDRNAYGSILKEAAKAVFASLSGALGLFSLYYGRNNKAQNTQLTD